MRNHQLTEYSNAYSTLMHITGEGVKEDFNNSLLIQFVEVK